MDLVISIPLEGIVLDDLESSGAIEDAKSVGNGMFAVGGGKFVVFR